ncbi:MAG: efflux RND transporter permease subunit [Chrysiogenetes bacterium]|nr:efflux RND transporter permease subunit [Chrysiogenetes bacterium]
MIAKLIALCARNRVATILIVAALSGWGYWSAKNAPLDALPDLSDVQVIVLTEWPGRSPDLVEDQITFPLTTTLMAAPKVEFVRGQTFFGLSFVNVVFEDGTDMYWARSRVLEYLTSVAGDLPAGVTPTLGPDATGVGWVFQYALVDKSGGHDLQELRSIQDWNVRYALQSVKGVAEVAGVGGFVKQYQIQIDPNRLNAFGLSLKKVIDAVRDSNNDVGGRVLEIAGTENFVRGRGYVRSVADLENVPVGTSERGTPIFVRDLGEVHLGPDLRRGAVELDGEGEVVGGIVVMRYGENALEVINAVKDRLEEVRRSLPEGVEIVVTYDRSGLIEDSVATISDALIQAMVVVSLVIVFFLFHVRSALVAIIMLPMAVLLSFIPMLYQHLTINIMSLGGIIVALGDMVDASIVLIENMHKRLEEYDAKGEKGSRSQALIEAMQEVGPSVFYSLLVITVAFIPIFTLTGTEGRLFRPLGFTKTYSLGFAALLGVTLVPALAMYLIRGRIPKEQSHPVTRWVSALYAPVVRMAVRWRKSVIAIAVVTAVVTVPAYLDLGSEFMPPLNEGSILYMPTAVPGMSIDSATDLLHRMNRELKKFPEVEHVFGKVGRARSATDPAPLSMIETVITLKPKDQWRAGLTWDDLVAEMDRKVQVPGMPNLWWMPIQTRTEMLATGIRSNLGLKILGPDLKEIEKVGLKIEETLAGLPGTRSAFAERVTGGYFIDFDIRREAAARYGLTVGDVERVIETGIGGMNITTTVEGRERYPVNVRYARDYRSDLDALGRVLVATPTGAQIPLAQLADIRTVTGAPLIRDENGQLAGYVFVDVDASISIGEYVQRARDAVHSKVDLPPGYRLEWGGQYRYLEHARDRLQVIVPLTLLLVFILIYFNFGNFAETLIVLLAVPFALVGAVWLMWAMDYNLSVAVWVGMIALAGLGAQMGIVMMLYLDLAWARHEKDGRLTNTRDMEDAIVEGSAGRIRPIMMTVATDLLALVPVMWATGTGAEVMKRIAAPMFGGLLTAAILTLVVYPAIFAVWKGRALADSPEAA